jgi:hypothetical protein
MAWGGMRGQAVFQRKWEYLMGTRGGWSHCFVYQLLLSVMSSDKVIKDSTKCHREE